VRRFATKGQAPMRWITEDQYQHVLVLESDEPLLPAFIAFWKRILSDGISNATQWQSLSVDIQDRQVVGDTQGCMHAVFLNAQLRPCESIGHYAVRSDAFDLYQGADENNDDFNKRELPWFLQHYAVLKQAAMSTDVLALMQEINRIRPLRVDASTAFGWFDLQIGVDSFGTLPEEDQAMLAGLEPVQAPPLADLTEGMPLDLAQELNDALISYTPEHFKVICCEITMDSEAGQPALFYKIECPDHPEDGTTVVNDRVHTAATRLVRAMTADGGAFPGLAIRLELADDGDWQANLKLLQAA
jgi:hypothetical protein